MQDRFYFGRAAGSRGAKIALRVTGPVLFLVTLLTCGAAVGRADTQTIACTQPALSAAFASGGSYVYSADCSLTLDAEQSLAAAKTLALDSAGHAVRLGNFVDLGGGRYGHTRFATIDGTLTLTGITLIGFAAQGANGAPGAPGAAGQDGAPGVAGTAGGPGGPGGNGASVTGGALLIDPSGDVTLTGVTFDSNQALGGSAGTGGGGGAGGQGGGGVPGANATAVGADGGAGGNGGGGGAGGAGGADGTGGDGYGGAIANAGTLRISGSDFESNVAHGGSFGGGGNNGGRGGYAGAGGSGGSGDYGNGGAAGNGGAGGKGGNGGAVGGGTKGYGGAIYNTGQLEISDTKFASNEARGFGTQPGFGGRGGNSGDGGGGGGTGYPNGNCGFCVPPPGANPNAASGRAGKSTAGGDGGDGSTATTTGTSIGGAVYSTRPFVLSGGSTSNDTVSTADSAGGNESCGGLGGHGGQSFDARGNGSLEPNGQPGAPTSCTTFHTGYASAPEFYPDPDAANFKVTVSALGADGKAYTSGAQTLSAKVTVSLAATASGAVSNVQITPPPVSADPSTAVTQSGDPTPAPPSGISLSPGDSTSYTVPFTVNGTGRATLSATATATAADGVPLRVTGTQVVDLGAPFAITVHFLQNGKPATVTDPGNPPLSDAIRLKDNDQGEIPQDATAHVTITNVSSVKQTNVSVSGLPLLSYHSPADANQLLPIAITGDPAPFKGSPPLSRDLSDVPPGGSSSFDYTVHVTGNGAFDFSPLLLSADADGGQTHRSIGAGTLTALPTALLWLELKPTNPGLIPAGLSTNVVGRVTNRSLTQSLDIEPLIPDTTGNAGGGGLSDVTQAPLPDGVVLPLAGTLKPGQSVVVEGTVATGYAPGTRGELTYAPAGGIIDSPGHETALTVSQIGMSAGSSPIDIHVDQSIAVPPVTVGTLFDSMTDAAMMAGGQWAAAHLQAGIGLLQHPLAGAYGIGRGIAGFAYTAAADVGNAASLLGAMYVLSIGYESMTPEERGNFADGIVADYEASHLGGDVAALKAAADPVLLRFETARQTGDYNAVAAMTTRGLVTGAGAIADKELGDIAFQKLALGVRTGVGKVAGLGEIAKAIRLSDGLREAGVTSVLGKGIAAAKPGVNLLAGRAKVLIEDFGLTAEQITALRNYCQQSKIIVAVRSRSQRAAQLIRQGLAVAKNEAIKLKGVNQIDVDFLGYSRHDLNTIVWAEPLSQEAVEARIAGLDPNMRAVVQERYATRVKEWRDAKIRKVLKHGEQTGEIEWGFNGADNGSPGVNRSDRRRFGLKDQTSPVKGTPGRTYQQVLVGNKPNLLGRLVPITQDVDLMAILASDGRILTAEQRTAVYLALQRILDIQHPETPTWLLDGEIWFQAKAKQLADVVPGGEPLAVFNPFGGVTAGFFDPLLTIFDNSTKGGRIFFKGGFNDPLAHWRLSLGLTLKQTGFFSFQPTAPGVLAIGFLADPGSASVSATASGGPAADLTTATATTAVVRRSRGFVIATARLTVRQRGHVKLVLRLNRRGLAVLRRRHRLPATVTLTFRARGAHTAQSITQRVVFRSRRR